MGSDRNDMSGRSGKGEINRSYRTVLGMVYWDGNETGKGVEETVEREIRSGVKRERVKQICRRWYDGVTVVVISNDVKEDERKSYEGRRRRDQSL